MRNPSAMWIQSDHAFEQIVSSEDFHKAQAIIHHRLCVLDRQTDARRICGTYWSPVDDFLHPLSTRHAICHPVPPTKDGLEVFYVHTVW